MAEVIMPKMGDAMTEGKVVRWIKQAGDRVARGDAIAEIETDKVNVDIEAEWDGTLAQVLVGPGEVALVGAPIAVIARPGETLEATPAQAGADARPAAAAQPTGAAQPATTTQPAATSAAAPTTAPNTPASPPQPSETDTAAAAGSAAVRASPLARRMAEQHSISLTTIKGSGPEGRVTKEDVEAAIAAARSAPEGQAAAAPGVGAREVPLSRMRQTIARRMTESKQQVPHIYITVSIAMDAALALRRQLNDSLDDARKVSVNDLVIKAAALALTQFPNINASFADRAVRYSGEINISIAVALPEGLLSTTVYDCDRKPVWQIAAEAKAVAERARSAHLRPEDLTNGTFTVSNLGMYGVDVFSAIITPPQAAILAVGAAKAQPVARDGRVEVATMMQVTLAADHRVTDGAEVARFLAELRRLLENPVWLVVSPPDR